MAISTMEKLVLIVPKSDIDKMLKTLVFSRCVEIRPLDVVNGNDNEGEEASQDGFLKKPEYQTEKFECDRLLARIKDSLEFIAPYRTDKKGLFAAKPSVCEEKYSEDNESYKTGIEAVTKICALSDKLSSLDTEYKKCEELLTMLSPWDTFDLKLSESTTKNTLTVLGVIPKLFSLDSLLGELDEKGYRALIEKVSESESATYISITSHNEDFDAVSELLVKYGFLKSDFKNLTLTPYEESVKLKEKLEILQSEKENIKKEITEAAKFTCEIEFVYDVVKLKSIKTLAKEKLVCTEETVILSGYVPVKAKKRLEKRLEKLDCYFEFFEVSDEDDVPVELSNNAFATPVEFVEGLYSYPRYGSFDPSFLVAIFYYVIFGLMLADVGYGLLLVIAGFVGKKLLHPKPSMRKLLNLFAISGVSCIIWGILFGSYFGDMPVAVMTNMFGIENPPNVALWFDPVKSPINFLIVSIAMGVIHLFTGMGIKMWQLIKSGHPVAAIFDIGSWYILLVGVGLVIVAPNIGLVLAAIGAIMLIVSQGREEKNVFMKVFKGVGSLYNLINYASDLLSYSRIMALGLATAVIASVVNIVATLNGPTVVGFIMFIAVSIFGHVLNLVLNTLGSFVHTSRLQYIEFFGKFYEDGGRPFEPAFPDTVYTEPFEE